jgi:hypothetical protein
MILAIPRRMCPTVVAHLNFLLLIEKPVKTCSSFLIHPFKANTAENGKIPQICFVNKKSPKPA